MLGAGYNEFSILYQKNPKFIAPDTIKRSDYTHVLTLEADCLQDIFWYMQGENWSPNGEATELIRLLGLHHTSMSVGDVLYREVADIQTGEWRQIYHIVDTCGFKHVTCADY